MKVLSELRGLLLAALLGAILVAGLDGITHLTNRAIVRDLQNGRSAYNLEAGDAEEVYAAELDMGYAPDEDGNAAAGE